VREFATSVTDAEMAIYVRGDLVHKRVAPRHSIHSLQWLSRWSRFRTVAQDIQACSDTRRSGQHPGQFVLNTCTCVYTTTGDTNIADTELLYISIFTE